jgi:acyl-CoA synthetase (AMP-forming)/AMP-acid ligase II
MPLYHGAGHGLCVVPSIHAGCTIVLGKKFSHSKFWPEIRASDANVMQYVGELCRYLINAPPSSLDKSHKIKMAFGNGMRPDVWEAFRERFGIPIINELYAATDGMGSMFNENHGEFSRNAIGLRGIIWHALVGKKEVQVKMDIDTEQILRDKNGFAIKCKSGEPGEVIHMVDSEPPNAQFAGYYGNPEAGEKRFIRNVFKKGDM